MKKLSKNASAGKALAQGFAGDHGPVMEDRFIEWVTQGILRPEEEIVHTIEELLEQEGRMAALDTPSGTDRLRAATSLRVLEVMGVTKPIDALGTLGQLRYLCAHRATPRDLGALKELEVLFLDSKVVPDGFDRLRSLRWLKWQGALSRLPASLASMPLEHLSLEKHPLKEEKTVLPALKKLRFLSVIDAKVDLSPQVWGLAELETLILHEMKELPDEISSLKKLRLLRPGARLSRISPAIGELKELEALWLNGCQKLKAVPDSLGGLPALQDLDLEYTAVTSLPDGPYKSLSKLTIPKQCALPPALAKRTKKKRDEGSNVCYGF